MRDGSDTLVHMRLAILLLPLVLTACGFQLRSSDVLPEGTSRLFLVAPEALRTGRKATRSIAMADSIEASTASGTPMAKGMPARPQYIST